MSKRDVTNLPAARDANLLTHDAWTNQGEKVEQREPLGVTVQQYANKSTAKQVAKLQM